MPKTQPKKRISRKKCVLKPQKDSHNNRISKLCNHLKKMTKEELRMASDFVTEVMEIDSQPDHGSQKPLLLERTDYLSGSGMCYDNCLPVQGLHHLDREEVQTFVKRKLTIRGTKKNVPDRSTLEEEKKKWYPTELEMDLVLRCRNRNYSDLVYVLCNRKAEAQKRNVREKYKVIEDVAEKFTKSDMIKISQGNVLEMYVLDTFGRVLHLKHDKDDYMNISIHCYARKFNEDEKTYGLQKEPYFFDNYPEDILSDAFYDSQGAPCVGMVTKITKELVEKIKTLPDMYFTIEYVNQNMEDFKHHVQEVKQDVLRELQAEMKVMYDKF